MEKTTLYKVLTLSIIVLCGLSACGFDRSNDAGRASANLNARKSLEYGNTIANGKLAPPKGFVHKSLFSERLSDDADRIDRLEDTVQSLHDQLQDSMPAIESLTAIESEIKMLVTQLKTLVEEESTPAPVNLAGNAPAVPSTPKSPPMAQPEKLTPKPASTPPQPAASTPVNTSKYAGPKDAIKDVRVAEGQGKTRIVFDAMQKLNYTIDYDAAERLIMVTSNASGVGANLSALARKSSHVEAVTSTGGSGGTSIIISLTRNATLTKGAYLSPSAQNANHRYYFDIMAK